MLHIFGGTDLKADREFPLEGIRTLWVKTGCQDVLFFHGDSEKLKVREYLRDYMEIARVQKRGDALCLDISESKIHLDINLCRAGEAVRMEFFVPPDFEGQIYVETASGDIQMDTEWKLENLQFKTASGDISMGRIHAGHFLIESASGDIDVKEAWGDRQFIAVSGDLNIGGGKGNTYLKTVSGDIDAVRLFGGAEIKTTSGDIEAVFEGITEDVGISSISGDIDLKIAAGSLYSVEAKATSGDVQFFLSHTTIIRQSSHSAAAVVGAIPAEREGLPAVTIAAVSGDIMLRN